MSNYNYGPLEHELAGGTFADDSAEHEQPAREGEKWVYNYTHEHAARHGGWHIRIRNDNGDCLAHALNERTAATIVYDHRLAALVPGLVGTITELLNQFYPHQCHIENSTCRRCDILRNASQLLNTVTKEREK